MPLSEFGNAKSNLRLIILLKQSMLLQKSNKACVMKNCTNKSLHHVKPLKRDISKICLKIFAYFFFFFFFVGIMFCFLIHGIANHWYGSLLAPFNNSKNLCKIQFAMVFPIKTTFSKLGSKCNIKKLSSY